MKRLNVLDAARGKACGGKWRGDRKTKRADRGGRWEIVNAPAEFSLQFERNVWKRLYLNVGGVGGCSKIRKMERKIGSLIRGWEDGSILK